jgi:hypothetical protein
MEKVKQCLVDWAKEVSRTEFIVFRINDLVSFE